MSAQRRHGTTCPYPPVQPPGCNNYTGRHPEGGRPTSVETARGLAQKHRLRPHIFLPTTPSPPGSSYLNLHKHATPTLLSRHRPHSRAPDFTFTHKNPIKRLLPFSPPPRPMSNSRSELESFDPFAEHPFTCASGSSGAGAGYATGIPVNAYPAHVVAASTSPAARSNLSQSPASSPASSQSPGQPQAAPQPIQSPQPRYPLQTTRGFSISSGASTTSSDSGNAPRAIFESFRKDSLTPDLDNLPLSKRRTNAWGTKELEESVRNE